MKAKERAAQKALSPAELSGELHKAQEKFFRLSFKHSTAPLENPLELRELRRQVARLKTLLREKEVSARA